MKTKRPAIFTVAHPLEPPSTQPASPGASETTLHLVGAQPPLAGQPYTWHIRLWQFLGCAGIVGVGFLLAEALQPGPGFGIYPWWSQALRSGNPDVLPSTTLSPTGFPLLHWYPGTGYLLLIPQSFVVLFLTLGWCGMRTFARTVDGHTPLTLFGVAMLLIGTNSGYYLRLIGSEEYSFVLLLALVAVPWLAEQVRMAELITMGSLTGLLLFVRPQTILGAFPALVMAVWRFWQTSAHWRTCLQGFACLVLTFAIGLSMVLQFNYWMTGSVFSSPYLFGNAEFQAVDHSARYLYKVLFDASAGFFSNHPLHIVGLFALVVNVCSVRRPGSERLFFAAALLCALLQIWMISGYYGWSGGAWIFGSRYLLLLSIYSVMAVLALLGNSQLPRPLRAVVFVVSVLATAYSLRRQLPLREILVFTMGSLLLVLSGYIFERTREMHTKLGERTFTEIGWAVLLFPLGYHMETAVRKIYPNLDLSNLLQLAGYGLLVCVVLLLIRGSLRMSDGLWWCPLSRKTVAVLALLLLAGAAAQVVRLREGSKLYQAAQLKEPNPRYEYINTFNIANFEADLAHPVHQWDPVIHEKAKNFLAIEKERTKIIRP
jgi:hypothetical protein